MKILRRRRTKQLSRIKYCAFLVFLILFLAIMGENSLAMDSDVDCLDEEIGNCNSTPNIIRYDTEEDGYGYHCFGDSNSYC